MRSYRSLIESGDTVLTDGATGTRVRLETTATLDPVLDMASLAIGGDGYVLRAVAGEYAAIARATGFPIELDAMTYWASPDHLRGSDRLDELALVNRSCVDALAPIRATGHTFVAGVIGPRADGYRSGAAMDVYEAADYHTPQSDALAASGVDLLLASTMSSATEAVGLATALSRTPVDYVVGYVVDDAGNLPDGTALPDLVRAVDAIDGAAPVHHVITCTHPSVALGAMRSLRDRGDDISHRVIGIKANGALASPDVLESTRHVLSDAPLDWVEPMLGLHTEFGFRVLGGCCGTDGRHLLALAIALRSLHREPDSQPKALEEAHRRRLLSGWRDGSS